MKTVAVDGGEGLVFTAVATTVVATVVVVDDRRSDDRRDDGCRGVLWLLWSQLMTIDRRAG